MCREEAGSVAAYGGFFYFFGRKETAACIRRCTASGGPKPFHEVVGQAHITDTLQRQVAEGRTAHAYLFTGTRGTGKTTCARILAKAVNCEHPGGRRPLRPVRRLPGHRQRHAAGCDWSWTPPPTTAWIRSGHLREEAVYTPAVLKKRVYIIDEVHMLSIAGLQRPAEDSGGAAGAPDVHSGHHGAAQGPGHHPVPVPALLLQAACCPGISQQQLLHIAQAEQIDLSRRRGGAAGPDGQRRHA